MRRGMIIMSHKSKTTIRWFRSIIIILLPGFLFCSVLCAYLLHISEKNVMEINTTISSHVQKNVDNKMEELYRYAATIEISSSNTLLKNRKEMPEIMPKQAYQLTDTLKDYLITNTFVRNAYIYYPNIDLVVSDMGCFSSKSYYALQGYPETNGYSEWRDTLLSLKGTQIRQLTFQKDQRVSYIHTMVTENEITAIMVIEIDTDKLISNFESANTSNTFAIGLLLNENVITSTGNLELLNNINILYEEWNHVNGDVVKNNDTYGFFNSSSMFDLTYVTVYAADQLIKGIQFPMIICMTGVVLCIIIGIVGAVYISIRNAKPMENLLTVLGGKTSNTEDEYQFIIHKFEKMTEEKCKSEELMQNHQILLNGLFLSSLLSGHLRSENDIFAEAKRYEVTFEFPIYQVIILASQVEDVPEHSLTVTSLQEILNRLGYSSLITAYRRYYVILLNTEEPTPENELNEMLQILQPYAFPDSSCLSAIGICCDNMSDIVKSYHCALKALRNLKPSDKNTIIYYQTEKEVENYGNIDLMKMFSDLIYSKEFLQAKQLVRQLYKEYIYQGNTQAEILRKNAIINLLVDSTYSILPQKEADNIVSQLIDSQNSLDAFLQQTDNLLCCLHEIMNTQRNSKIPIVKQAKQFIDENYTDPMLGLYMVSDKLGVSNSYLSSIFKKEYGINVIQYINQLRINQAKYLILNTKKNIKEIAQDVGFSSDINFIRVFKKIENQTPTMLRKKNTK